MSTSNRPETIRLKAGTVLRITLWDIFTGLPAGLLIFMATVLFSTLLGFKTRLPEFVPLLILTGVAFLVGVLAGISRLRKGPATAFIAGMVTVCILGYLWIAARPGDQFNSLVIGPVGMFVAIVASPFGGWYGARLRKAL